MKKATFLIFAIIWMVAAFPQALKNLTQVSHTTFDVELNDVWGYVAPDGTEYALVGRQDGVSIFSLTDPANPVEVADIPGQMSIWRDLKTHGEYAYVSHDAMRGGPPVGDGTLIIDLSDLPNSFRYKDTVMNGIEFAHNVWIADGVLYSVGNNNFNGGMAMFDLSDPWNPSFLGAYTEHYVHDVYVRDDLAYTGEINDAQLSVVNVIDKAAPARLGTVTYPGAFTHNTWLNDAGTVCFSTDELDRAYIYSWDVTNPQAMTPLDRIRSSLSDGRATPHNVHVLNDYIITSYYKDGIQIVDAARPHNLIEVGYYDTSPLSGGGTDGCWGAYPFLPSGLVLATDIEEGFFVLSPTYNRAAYLEGTVTNVANNNPINNVEIDISDPLDMIEFTDAFGEYATGSADNVNLDVSFAKYGYKPQTFQVSLTQGQLTQLDVQLAQAQPVNISIEVNNVRNGQPIPDAEVLIVAPADEFTFDYQTDGTGKVSITNFLEGKYDVIAGKWGFITNQQSLVVDANTNRIIINLEPGYYDDFAFDFGWNVQSTAPRGAWEWGEPEGTTMFDFPANPDFDLEDDFGPFCYVTGNGGGEFFEDDVDDGQTILTSPAMDLSGYNMAVLDFYWWLLNFDANNLQSGNDYFRVELSDDGTNWVQAFESTTAWRNNWQLESQIDFAQYFTNLTSTMHVRFVTADDDPGNIVEAAVDGFFVYDPTTVDIEVPRPLADVTLATGDKKISLNYGTEWDKASFRLLDVSGKLLLSGRLEDESTTISLENIPEGVYIVDLVSNRGQRVAKKFFNLSE